MPFDLFSDRVHGRMRPQKSIRELLIFSEESEQKVFRLDVRASELTRLIPGKEDNATRLFRVTLKHLVMAAPLWRSTSTSPIPNTAL
jgi:hypothetical protein